MTRFAAEDSVAARLMDAAEIVFTTLSSTGRRAFAHARRFDLVLIDEAAQASEMATLQPLTLASGKCDSDRRRRDGLVPIDAFICTPVLPRLPQCGKRNVPLCTSPPLRPHIRRLLGLVDTIHRSTSGSQH